MMNDDEPFNPGADDGTFLMSYDDFSAIFNNMYICIDFPEQWNGIRYKGAWEKDNSGGIPEPIKDEKAKKNWAMNPQFCI
jgi:calpain